MTIFQLPPKRGAGHAIAETIISYIQGKRIGEELAERREARKLRTGEYLTTDIEALEEYSRASQNQPGPMPTGDIGALSQWVTRAKSPTLPKVYSPEARRALFEYLLKKTFEPKPLSLETVLQKTPEGYEPTITAEPTGSVRGITYRPKPQPKTEYPESYRADLGYAISRIQQNEDPFQAAMWLGSRYPERSAEINRILLSGEVTSWMEAISRPEQLERLKGRKGFTRPTESSAKIPSELGIEAPLGSRVPATGPTSAVAKPAESPLARAWRWLQSPAFKRTRPTPTGPQGTAADWYEKNLGSGEGQAYSKLLDIMPRLPADIAEKVRTLSRRVGVNLTWQEILSAEELKPYLTK